MTNGMKHLVSVTILLAASASTTPARAQEPIEPRLRQIFASGDFAPQRFGPARWLDSDSYTTVERTAQGAAEIVRYDARSGARAVLITSTQLTPSGQSTPLVIADYIWSPDHSHLLIFTNTQRVWRDETRGDYWVLNRQSGALRKLGGDAAPSTLMFAKFSPDGSRVGYVRTGDIYVEEVASGRITRLTNRGGAANIVNGTTDWVYEEEFSLRDAFRFSPDGKRIAYWQFDMSGVRDFLLVNNTDSLYSFTIPIQYPKAGTTNSAVRVGVVSTSGGPTTWIKLPGDPRDDYVPRMEWVDANRLLVQRVNRLQNTNRVLLANAATGAVRDVITERDSAWLDVVNDMTMLDDDHFLWVSERDGWRRLYSVPLDGADTRVMTKGDYDVLTNRGTGSSVTIAGGYIYIPAAPENPTQRYLYRFPVTGGAGERLTPPQPGTHTYNIAPGARYAFHTHSTFDTPPITDLVELPSHSVLRTLVSNERLRAAVAPLVQPTEFFQVDVGGGVQLDGWMIKPRNFDPSKKYPLLTHVYTEPWSTTVNDAWGGASALWHRALADQGYIVVSVDNRGTPAPKGRDWRKIVYGEIGVLASREQAAAVRALTAQRPYIDASRVGVWGWSGGGSATLNAMFRYPDVYHVGMSVAPVPDQKLYDTVYQERYMGLPQENADGYFRGSPINFAEGLRGDLLIVHGSGDDNVHAQGTERLVNRLVQLGKQFEYMSYPNRSHCICEGEGTTLHVYTLLTNFLLEHLPAGGR